MTLYLQDRHDCILVSGGNERSTSMLRKLFTALEVRKKHKLIIHSRLYLAKKLGKDLPARIIAPLIDLGLKANVSLRHRALRSPDDLVIDADIDIEALCEQLDDTLGCLGQVKVLRSVEYLRWRYSQNPHNRFHAVAALRDGQIAGYAVFTRESRPSSDVHGQGLIVDWQVSEIESESTLKALFCAAVDRLTRLGIDEIYLVLNDEVSQSAAFATGFSLRDVEDNFYVFHRQQNSPLLESAAWYHSYGDIDTL